MGSRKTSHRLSETIHSLLGWKSHLTSNWANSVFDIMKSVPPELASVDLKQQMDDELREAISKIEDELVVLTAHINQLNTQRRKVLNEFLDLRGNIRVFCRIRPFSAGESSVSASNSSSVLLKLAENKCKTYSFDKVFHPNASQDEVFAEIEPVIKSALDGYNACIFAYGQTGTGKSFTMEGTPNSRGVVSRSMEAIFKQAVDSNHVFLFSFSMLEIYLGNLRDLLVPQPTKPMDPMPPSLSIQTDPKGGIEIDNLVAIRVTNFNQALRLYKLGCRFRSTASTNSNTTSSRSHCLIRLSITSLNAPERRQETNKIWFIDLGGSERVLKTKASGRRLEEGKAINLSLSALGDVIHALHKKNCHVPFRNSKLTQVLKDSLGEDSKTLLLVHVSPKEEDRCETVCSLGFATRARSIHLGNAESTDQRREREDAITKIQQKMKMIEDERRDTRRNIDTLNKEIEKLTGKASIADGEPKAFHLWNKLDQNSPETTKSNNTEITSSKTPRFMKPTVCSNRRKTVVDYHTFEEKFSVSARRRRRSLTHRAESVNLPVKHISDYNSECSISRNSGLTGLNVSLNVRSNADEETVYSHDAADCDIKSVICRDQVTLSKSSFQQRNRIVDSASYGKREIIGFRSTNISKVDNWLHLHRNEPTVSSVSHKSKQVLAIPVSDKKNTRKRQKQDRLGNEKNYNRPLEKAMIVADNGKIEKCVHVADRRVKVQIGFMKTDLICNSNIDIETILQPITSVNEVLMEGRSTASSRNSDSKEDDKRANMFVAQVNDDRLIHSNSSDAGNSEWYVFSCSDSLSLSSNRLEHSPHELVHGKSDTREDNDSPISASEHELQFPQILSEMDEDDNENNDNNALDQTLGISLLPGIRNMRTQRALFADNGNPKEPITRSLTSQEDTEQPGICHLLARKIEILCACLFLALGLQHLGLQHEFYHGLTL